MSSKQNGFTVIEVLMFIGISGLLLLGAMASISGSITSTRFNDAVNSTTSFIQSQYGAVASGRNSRLPDVDCNAGTVTTGSTSVAGMTNCVILGRLIEFNVGGTSISSRYIVGRDTTAVSTGDTAAVVAAVATAPAASTDAEFAVPWSTKIEKMSRGLTSVNYLAIIRSPVSERVLFYSFQAAANLTSLNATPTSSLLLTDTNLNKPLSVCLWDDGFIGGRVGYVKIGEGQGQDIIKSDLTSNSGTCA